MLFNQEDEFYVPQPSFTQKEVYFSLYEICWNDNRFEGPGLELRTGRCSHDIIFLGANGEKIAYEIDCQDYHNPESDKKRDYYLQLKFGWKVFRVDCRDIDQLGFVKMGELIFAHLLNELGLESRIILPGAIVTTQKDDNLH